MDTTTPAMQALALRLIALESAPERPGGAADAAARACDRLQAPLSKLMGQHGFRTLMARAGAMTTPRSPMRGAGPTPSGGPSGGPGGDGPGAADPAIVLAHLLGLLATFIGEPLTLSLVRDAWPDAIESEAGLRIGEGS